MAYQKEWRPLCEAPGCTKWARVEVFNNKNASLGRFCSQCGHRVLIRTQKLEEPKHVD